MDGVAGAYLCSAYIGTAGENDYHHVRIEEDDEKRSAFRWVNRAGKSWTLTSRPGSSEFLLVGSDCPYYSKGHVKCKVERNSRGQIVALYGPGNEKYEKSETSTTRRRPPLTLPMVTSARNLLGEQEDSDQRLKHAFILPLSSTGADWGDLAFLAAIPASARLNHGRPTVLVPDELDNKDDDAFVDFMTRYKPTGMTIFHSDQVQIDFVEEQNDDVSSRGPNVVQHQVWDDLHSVSVCLAKAAWWSAHSDSAASSSSRIVAVRPDDYAAALLASSVAARIGAPLFFVDKNNGWESNVLQAIRDLRPSEILFVGEGNGDNTIFNWIGELSSQGDPEEKDDVVPCAITIAGVTDAISWLSSQDLSVDYLAVVNPADRTANKLCTSRKLSLTGPVYTARRAGLIVPVPNVPIKNSTKSPDPEALQRTLETLRCAIGACPRPPEHVALIGGFDVMPPCQTNSDCNNSKIYAVTDIPYGQLNDEHCGKKFRDTAIGRIYAESLCCGTLLAARTVNYELLPDGTWDKAIVESGSWGFPELGRLFQVAQVDYAPARHLLKSDISKLRTVEAAAFLHKDHSSAVGLGNSVSSKSTTLFAPAVALSRGCHAAGIDEGNRWHGSVAGRMLGRGCVCFVGSPRSPTTANTLTEVAFFHELLYGGDMSVGRAMRSAFNKSMVHHLDGGRMTPYCLDNEVLLGDPALVPCFAKSGQTTVESGSARVTPATATLDEEGIVTVVGPSEWTRTPIHPDQLKEWKYEGSLFTYVAPLVEQETVWCGNGYDQQELYYVVSISLPPGVGVNNVVALDAVERLGGTVVVCKTDAIKRWWPSGRHYLQHHWDGSTTVRWRLRLLDYDMQTGAIKAELKSARFRLVLT